MAADPVRQALRPSGLGEGQVRGAKHCDEDLGLSDLAGPRTDGWHPLARVVDEDLLTGDAAKKLADTSRLSSGLRNWTPKELGGRSAAPHLRALKLHLYLGRRPVIVAAHCARSATGCRSTFCVSG
jgi:hypothetical protein